MRLISPADCPADVAAHKIIQIFSHFHTHTHIGALQDVQLVRADSDNCRPGDNRSASLARSRSPHQEVRMIASYYRVSGALSASSAIACAG